MAEEVASLVNADFGIPYQCGLGGVSGKEIEAEWYQRLPFALEVTWTVRTRQPYAGGVWTVGYLLVFDSEGRVQPKPLVTSNLVGPHRPPPLSPQARAYRIAHGLPLEDDPYRGDSLTLSTELLVGEPLP